MPKLILASASKRREDLLNQIGIKADLIKAADIDESVLKGEKPSQYAKRIAENKADKIANEYKNSIILSADTVVSCGSRILPKANDDNNVEDCLKMLSGKQHTVITAICVISPKGIKSIKNILTKVRFKKLSANEINQYVKSKEGIGKAGGYAIQGLAGAFVKNINGSYSSVVGLPLYEAKNMLDGIGYD